MGFTAEKLVAKERAAALVERFPFYVEQFDKNPPFTEEQLQAHLHTICLRRSFPSVEGALAHDSFLGSLYRTLRLWGIGKRTSKLAPFGTFSSALKNWVGELSGLQAVRLEEGLDLEGLIPKLWNLVANLRIVDNKNTVVAGTKCIHHLLPDLLPPMDRAYTQTFFGWENPEFQNNPRECFEYAFRTFARIAKEVKPSELVGDGWRSSGPKILDNAVVSYCRVNGLESSNRKYERRRKARVETLTKRAKELGIYEEILAEVNRRTRRQGRGL